MDVRFRPYTWVGERTPPNKKRRSPFSTSWNKTLYKLEYELSKVRANEIIIEADFQEEEIRLDGWPRVNARPRYGGVKISFNQPGVGRVEYPCDSCVDWQDNVHSIALGLEALRAIDRYGISGRMQQYTGFRALEGGNGRITTRTQAAEWIADQIAHREPQRKSEIQKVLLGNWPEDYIRPLIRIASKKLHPDTGGSDTLWKKFEEAKQVLGL